MKRINTSGRLSGQRGGNVVHRLDLRSSTVRRKQRRGPARLHEEPSGAAVGRIEEARPVNPTETVQGTARMSDVGDSQARHQIQLLERRLRKMTLLLEQQGQEISSGRGLEDHGVASEFREVQGLDSADAQAEHKKTLMESIFRENVKLRERVTSSSSPAR